MKQNPYLTALLTAGVLLLVFGALFFLVGNLGIRGDVGAAVAGFGGLLFPIGLLALVLWVTACSIVWRPSDEPAAKRGGYSAQ